MSATPVRHTIHTVTTLLVSQVREGDLYVDEVTISMSDGARWWAIVYRPSTDEVFKIFCWDNATSNRQPDLPGGTLPSHITFVKPAA